MKTAIIISAFAFFIICSSCNENKPSEIKIIGKWWKYDIPEKEYNEFDIDEKSIGIFSHGMGNIGMTEYNIDGDTLYFREGKFNIKFISDNQFIMSINGHTDTLNRLSDSITTFNVIDHHNDSVFDIFYDRFQNRAYETWIKYGYVTREELENSFIEYEEND